MGKPIGEVEVRLRADISKLEADLRKAEGKTKTASAKMSKSFNKMTKSVLKFAAAAVGIAAVSRVMKSLIKNAGDDEAATTRLSAAMKSAGVHSDELVEKLSAQAKAHDLVSAASETELVHAQAYLLNMGVTADMMDTALLATTNLAAGLGWDLSQATLNVGKTFGGFAGELSEVIPALKGMSVEAFQAGDALAIINENFGGQALEKISTFQGKVGELSDAWDVFAATVGRTITSNEDLLESLDNINDTLRDPSQARGWASLLEDLITVGVGVAGGFDKAAEGVVEFSAKYEQAMSGLHPTLRATLGQFIPAFAMMDEMTRNFGIGENFAEILALAGEIPENVAKQLPIDTTTKKNKKSGGTPLLTPQQIKANKDLQDKLLADKRRAAAAANDIRIRSRDTYLNATGQEVLAIQERLAREIAAFTEMEEKGDDWSQQKIEAAAIAQAEIADLQASEMEEWNRLFEFMEDGFNGALASMLLDGEFTFKALADSFLREFLKIGIAKTTAGIFSSLGTVFGAVSPTPIGPLQADGTFNGTGVKELANGGPISGPSLVGESGPELFIPHTSGFVANNQSLAKMGGGGSQVSVTVINNTGQETSTTERDGPGGTKSIEVLVGKAISKNIARGGDVDQAIRNSYGVNRIGRHGI